MSNKGLLKVGAAVALLAIVLIFLGVNYVPQIFASSPPQNTNVDSVLYTRPDYTNELYPRAIAPQLTRSNYADELYPRAILSQLSLAGSDWIERHPILATPSPSLTGSDWIERHPSGYYTNSDWIERHPSGYYTNSDWIERHPIPLPK
jgi:hypothetical protein